MSVVTTEREAGVALVTIRRPEKLNALDPGVLGELTAAFAALEGSDVRVAILTGEGKAFVAGADIAAMQEMSPVQAKAFADLGHRLGALIESLPLPVIAAVNGFALGGGCELALACDFIYASERARFGQPEAKLGVIPGFGGTQRLARRVGIGLARELVYGGEMIGADRALAIGLVNAVFPSDELLDKTMELAKKIAQNGPLAVAVAKRVLLRGEELDMAGANELEAQAFAGLFGSLDQREGMRAFVEKRPAKFEGK